MMEEHTRQIAADAAAALGVSVEEWVAQAIWEQAQEEDERRRYAAQWKPGPWEGWHTRHADDHGHLEMRGPGGEEIWRYPDRKRQCLYPTTVLRPFSGRVDENLVLLNRRGALRTFSSAEAVKRAIDAHHGRVR